MTDDHPSSARELKFKPARKICTACCGSRRTHTDDRKTNYSGKVVRGELSENKRLKKSSQKSIEMVVARDYSLGGCGQEVTVVLPSVKSVREKLWSRIKPTLPLRSRARNTGSLLTSFNGGYFRKSGIWACLAQNACTW